MPALDGLKVVDLTRNTPGQHCGMLLSDMGADIVKIEEALPPSGRRAAGAGPQRTPEAQERALAFNPQFRNKRNIALNLKDERGREVFYQLARNADVVMEGFRPGVVKRLGVDYDTVAAMNPRIVYASISGYGQYGPNSQLPGHDINYISQGGALSVIGTGPDEPPVAPLNLVADLAGGSTLTAVGILAAIYSRERTGRGQYIDVGMSDAVMSLMSTVIGSYFESGQPPVRGQIGLGGSMHVYYNSYQCSDGKWLSIGSIEPYFYENFCKVVGREEWLPFQGAAPEKHAEMIAEARKIFRTRSRDEWLKALNATDLCAMAILDAEDLVNDPHTRARELVMELPHPKLGTVRQVGHALKFSHTPSSFRSFGARKGEHTAEVLGELGYSEQQIAELKDAGAVAVADEVPRATPA